MLAHEPDGTTTYLSFWNISMVRRARGLGVGPESGIEGGLAAAGLRSREVQVHAEPLQHVDGALAYFRIDLVNDAGYEQGCPDRR